MLYVLASGQSNCNGRGTDGVWGMVAGVTAWNSYSEVAPWPSPGVGNLGSAWVAPVIGNDPFYSHAETAGYNAPVAHGANYLKKITGEDVRIITVPGPSQEMDKWMSDSGVKGPYYTRMAAIIAAAAVPKFHAFIWQHGEADDISGRHLTYQAKWDLLIDALTTDGYIDSDTAIAIGRPTSYCLNIQPVLTAIADADDRIGIADTSSFNLIPGNGHFAGAMASRMGFEYIRALSGTDSPLAGMLRVPDFESFDPIVGNEDTDEFRKAKVEDLTPQRVFVFAAGVSDFTMANSAWTKVPLSRRFGRADLLSSGEFVADRAGVWKFQARGGGLGAGAGTLQIAVLDSSGAVIDVLAVATDSTNGVINGSTMLDLAVGDHVRFGARQITGGSVEVGYMSASNYFSFEATFMGAEG